MAVSVRMDPLLESDLEQAARRQGVTKSQFIIMAVERALGRKDPAQLYHRVMEEAAQYHVASPVQTDAVAMPLSTGDRLREKLQSRHQADRRDWLAYQEARKKGVAWAPDDEGAAQ